MILMSNSNTLEKAIHMANVLLRGKSDTNGVFYTKTKKLKSPEARGKMHEAMIASISNYNYPDLEAMHGRSSSTMDHSKDPDYRMEIKTSHKNEHVAEEMLIVETIATLLVVNKGLNDKLYRRERRLDDIRKEIQKNEDDFRIGTRLVIKHLRNQQHALILWLMKRFKDLKQYNVTSQFVQKVLKGAFHSNCELHHMGAGDIERAEDIINASDENS